MSLTSNYSSFIKFDITLEITNIKSIKIKLLFTKSLRIKSFNFIPKLRIISIFLNKFYLYYFGRVYNYITVFNMVLKIGMHN